MSNKARVVEYNSAGNVSGFMGKPEGKIFKFKSIDYLISGEQGFLLQLVSFTDILNVTTVTVRPSTN